MKQIVLLLAFLLSVSCHRRPLEDPANNTTLRVAVNIKAIMNITCDIYNLSLIHISEPTRPY